MFVIDYQLIWVCFLSAHSVLMNPSKQRFLQKKTLYDEGRIQTAELLSSDDLCTGVYKLYLIVFLLSQTDYSH